MGEKEFLAALGFKGDPFKSTNADEEEELQSYFVPPPYFNSVWGDPDHPKSHVVFAPRGGGKSAQRRMIEIRAETNSVFAVTYDRFEHLAGIELKDISVEYHLANIIALALLGFLLEYQTRGVLAPSFSSAERALIEALCHRYLGNISKLEAIKAADSLKTLSTRARELLKNWSGPLGSLASTALASHGIPAKVSLSSSPAVDSVERPSKTHLEVIRDLVLSVGFKSMYVLIDKVDESPETGTNAEDSFYLVRPMLQDLELLQMKGIAFKFFLWDKLQTYYRKFARPDRLQQFELSWTKEEINRILSRRLEFFSDGRVKDLSQLTSATLAQPLQHLVVLFAAGSPRDTIRICQNIVSEQLQIDPNAEQLSAKALVDGISKFANLRAAEIIPPEVLAELVKVGRMSFTANYVASVVFKIDANSARNKIRTWVQVGAVEKVGELSSGGRPIFHYAIADIRIARAVARLMSFGDFIGKKTAYCDALLIRDWDLGPGQSCHQCGNDLSGKVTTKD